jgi:hypothetical protein
MKNPEMMVGVTLPIALILLLSLTMNLWGNRWGAPDYWHPDELTWQAIGMFETRTFIPSTFYYGGLHYTVLEVGAVFPVRVYGKLFDKIPMESDTLNRSKWAERQQTRTICLGRSISALMATLQVFLTYLIGNLLFGRTVGILSSLFLCLSPYFIAISHFATIDTAANFWYWLACYFALMSWKKENDAWLWLASVTAGMAIGVKIDRIVIIFPFLFSWLKRVEGTRFRNLLKTVPLILLGYLLANPAFLCSPFQFLDGTSRDLFFNMGRNESDAASPFIQLLSDMKSGMGLLLFLGALGGLGVSVRNLLVDKERAEVAWLLVSILPYFLLVGSHFPLPWYVPFFFPASVILAAYGCREMQNITPPFFRMAVKAIPVVILISSLLTSISMDLQIAKDSRCLAAKWIEQQLPAGASIAVGERGPAISNETFRLTRLGLRGYDEWNFVRNWRNRLIQNSTYRFIRQSILGLEKFKARMSGLPVRNEPYKAWFDIVVERVEAMKKESGTDRYPAVEKTDYLVLTDHLDLARISDLMSPNSGYRLIKKFQYKGPFGIQVTFPFVNPDVYIFSRS